MKFSHEKLSDPVIQDKKIGPFAKRSARSKLAEQYEDMLRELAPYPISYDVNQGQPINYSEYTYTELLSGFWVATQSLELNCRLMLEASKYSKLDNSLDIDSIVSDKYVLDHNLSRFSKTKKVCFLPGHNMLDVASVEIIARLVHEDDTVLLKPHPITNEESLNLFATRFGWNKIIPKDISGNALLHSCEVVYTTSASEMAISGTLLGKTVVNVSNFFNEGSGAYHSINRLLFAAHKQGTSHAKELLLRILSCPWSGIHLHDSNVEDRLKEYYAKSLELREIYKPLASPRGQKKG